MSQTWYRDFENRVKKLQTGNGNEIHVVYTIETDYPFAMETMLHSRFFPKKRLNEWFELSNDDVVNFGKYCPLCIHEKEEESDPYKPCNDCLAEGARLNTSKPLNFKEKA